MDEVSGTDGVAGLTASLVLKRRHHDAQRKQAAFRVQRLPLLPFRTRSHRVYRADSEWRTSTQGVISLWHEISTSHSALMGLLSWQAEPTSRWLTSFYNSHLSTWKNILYHRSAQADKLARRCLCFRHE